MYRSLYDRANVELFFRKSATYTRADIRHAGKRTVSDFQYLEICSGAALFVIGIIGIVRT